nr:PREDICTED: probable RNA helicase armi [Bemisia tabaci]
MFDLSFLNPKTLFGFSKKEETEDDVCQEETSGYLDEMQAESEEEEDGQMNDFKPSSSVDEIICKECIGVVTGIHDGVLIIDGKHTVVRSGLDIELKLDSRVSYKVVTEDGVERICNIRLYEGDGWSTAEDEIEVETPAVETKGIKREIICEVEKKNGGILDLVTENYERCKVNMDEVSIKFIPTKGDLLLCEIISELDERSPNLFGDTVCFKNIKPLRSKLVLGEVTLWRDELAIGIINNEISFSAESCSAGYKPHVKDKVNIQCIESKQGALIWRAIHVHPESFNDDRRQEPRFTHNNKGPLYAPKNGVSVSLLTKNLSVNLGATLDLEVEVRNSGSEPHELKICKMRTQAGKSQISIRNSSRLPFNLNPEEKFIFKLAAKACNIGKTKETLVLTFNSSPEFYVGCDIELMVGSDQITQLTTSADTRTHERVENKYDRFNSLSVVPTRNGLICPGIRPIKAPAFIPVQATSNFNIPEEFYKAVLDPHDRQRKTMEAYEELAKIAPAVVNPLEPSNYEAKFHALLHLEELSVILKMRRFYQERAIFRPQGEYYALEVPNLTESRPSLIIGDEVRANLAGDSRQFQGYIHKTLVNEVLLKFNPAFDEVARSNTFRVSFVQSRSVYKKCHQAIDCFCSKDHLGVDWLFPNSIGEAKPPQVIFLEEDVQLQDEENNYEAQGPSSCETSASRIDKLSSLLDEDQILEANARRSPPSSASSSSPVSCTNGVTSGIEESEAPAENSSESKNTISTKQSSLDAAYQHLDHSSKLGREAEKIKWASSGRGYGQKRTKPLVVRPCQVAKKDRIKWYNKSLNMRQKEAVKNILKGEARPLPYIIHGPPGTGKTVTMVETILQILSLLPDSRLLVATPSNSAADLITERILERLNLYPGQLVRLVSYTYWNDGRVPPFLRPYAAIADIKEDPDKSETPGPNSIKVCSREVLGRHKITISTCTSIGIMYTLGFPVGHFTHVFVDEAGQTTEPEILIPLAFLHKDNGQAILAGDPMQLGPVIVSELAKPQLDKSLLYRLISRFPYLRDIERFPTTGGHDPRLVTKLLDNYRAVPELLEFTSGRFYDGELIAHVSTKNSREEEVLRRMASCLPISIRDPELACPFIFQGIRGENLQERDSPSWYNPQELMQVVIHLKNIYAVGYDEDSVGIITPYQKQASKIRGMINEMRLPVPKIGSVEEFQGQERPIIIVSVVRSREDLRDIDIQHALGFLKNPFRVNVATSRARALMIVIGNPHLLGHDCYWRNIIEYAAEIGGYTGCDYPDFLSFPRGNIAQDAEN